MIFWSLLLFAASGLAEIVFPAYNGPPRLKYSVVPGYFKQSSLATDDRTYDALRDSFGLTDPSPHRWYRFRQSIHTLNMNAPEGVKYVVLYLARHGQGHHNVAEKFFGWEGWDCYWAMQGTNGTYTWGPDAKLSPRGHSEVARTSKAWKHQVPYGVPLPESHHVSPLSRSLSTLVETWKPVALNPPRPICHELLRETLSLHYSDKRSKASYLRETYPEVEFPIEEEDPLWNFLRESEIGRNMRIKHVLDEILNNDPNTYIGMTSHLGVINSTLVALGHRPYALQTAGVLPVVVKVERDPEWMGEAAWRKKESWEIPKPEMRSVCPGYESVLVSGQYADGMGVWPYS
ncbi:histidine phosphatase superfamily [Tuber brumale]|nr:histidine phosphatase superfamily [Tuber brumale]